jgi:hypothetical protein
MSHVNLSSAERAQVRATTQLEGLRPWPRREMPNNSNTNKTNYNLPHQAATARFASTFAGCCGCRAAVARAGKKSSRLASQLEAREPARGSRASSGSIRLGSVRLASLNEPESSLILRLATLTSRAGSRLVPNYCNYHLSVVSLFTSVPSSRFSDQCVDLVTTHKELECRDIIFYYMEYIVLQI